jgi:vacuolar-type H+-ATPase catalytic subunit A/Vma1
LIEEELDILNRQKKEQAERQTFNDEHDISQEKVEKGMYDIVKQGFVDQEAYCTKNTFCQYKQKKFMFNSDMEKLIKEKYIDKYA